MNISRRDFLRLMGITGALAGGYSSVWAVPDEWKERLISGPRIETWKVSTCLQCPAGCGIRIRLIDDIPVRILGNKLAPANRGVTCPMGEAGLELLYHPDRITGPLVRKGEKGTASFEPVSWDEAMDQISRSLSDLTKKGGGGHFGFLMGDRNTELTRLVETFTASLGSSSFFPWRSPSVNELGFFQSSGQATPFAFDLEKCDYLLTFGTNLLEEPPSPLFYNRMYGSMKESRPRTGLRMVHVDSRMGQAGINATEWVRIAPGSMGILALGMIYVILRDNAYDESFIRNKGLSPLNIEDFRDLVNRNYYPDRVSQLTGIKATTVIRLAREFATARAPLALSGGTGDRGETGLFNQWAVTCLNAISGSFSVKGLWYQPEEILPKQSTLSSFDGRSVSFTMKSPKPGSGAVPSSWVTERLPEFQGAGNTPTFEMLMVAQVDPVYRSTNRARWEEFLSQVPLVVQFATLIDETSPYADLILPVPTYLEQWDLTLPVPNLTFPQIGMVHPIVSPKKGPRPLGDILISLAGGLNLKPFLKEASGSYRDYLQSRVKNVFRSGKGTPYFEEISSEFLEELRKRGWQVYSYPTFKDFWNLLQEKGGWWDPGKYPGADMKYLKTFAFPTTETLAALYRDRHLPPSGEDKKEIDGASPAWIEELIPDVEESADTFVLVPFSTLFNITGDGASQPLLQELGGLHPRVYWQSWAEMNPERASDLDLRDGDLIRVVSGADSFTVTVKVVPTVSPEILSVPLGKGHREFGRYAKGIGTNPLDFMEYRMDHLSGRVSWLSTRVKVEKITA